MTINKAKSWLTQSVNGSVRAVAKAGSAILVWERLEHVLKTKHDQFGMYSTPLCTKQTLC